MLLLAAAAHAQSPVVTNLITFDDLPDLTGIPNGYTQLNWSGLETITAIQDGYAVWRHFAAQCGIQSLWL